MPHEYKTISQRENIQDEDIAYIVDYIERVWKSIERISYHRWYLFKVNDIIELFFDWDLRLIIENKHYSFPTKLFRNEIVAFYSYFRNLK